MSSPSPAATSRGTLALGGAFPPRPLELGIGTARQPQLERGGTAGDQDLRGSVAVTAAIPSSGFVYKGKGNMCLV